MAWVEKTHKDKGHAWRVGYRGPDRRQRYKTFTRRADADLFAATVETTYPAAIGPTPPRQDHRRRLAYQVEASRLNRRPSAIARDDSYLRSFILPTFADHTLVQVQPVAVQQWVAKLNTAGYAPATIRKAYELLARIFTTGVASGLIARTPCRGVKLPNIEQSDKRYLTPTEVRHLAVVVDPRFRALVLTAACSGARFGELAGLPVEHYEPLKRTIRIERNLTEVSGDLAFGETKTRAARRTVSIPTWLVDVLAQHIATYPGDDGLIFTAPCRRAAASHQLPHPLLETRSAILRR